MAYLFTLFVDNLGQRVDCSVLRHKFSDYGVVKDVFIPTKRGKNSGRRFGFVRYDCPVSADVAVEKANGTHLLDNIIYVKRAAFNKHGLPCNRVEDRGNQGFLSATPQLDRSLPLRKESRTESKNKNDFGFVSSYADVASGRIQSQSTRVQAVDEGYEWLSRSAVGRLSAMRELDSLLEAFISEGVTNIQLKDMGGLLVLLIFESVEHMSSMLETAGKCWLANWFEDINRWSPDLQIEIKRVVWLSCYGVPLNLWNATTFSKIGNIWGDFITLDDATSNGSSFTVGRVKILTNVFEAFNQTIWLDFNGNSYPVRVIEEHFVVKDLRKATCKCIGCDNANVLSCPRTDGESDSDLEKGVGFVVVDGKVIPTKEVNMGVSSSLPVDGGLGKEDMADSNASCLGGDFNGDVHSERPKELLVEVVPEMSHSNSSPLSLGQGVSNSVVNVSKEKPCFQDQKSIHGAILKLERRLNRSKRKIRKKKMLSDIGIKAVKSRSHDRKVSSSSSLSSFDFCNRNAILLQQAELAMNIGTTLGVNFHGDRNFILGKYMELAADNIAEKKKEVFVDVEDGEFADMEEGGSLSLEF